MPAAGFQDSAPWYDALSGGDKRLGREGPFLLEALARAPGPRVLDTACGTGLHALFLAEHGALVTGADLSEAMVAHARTHRTHPCLQYVTADMRTPPAGPWDLALCLGNSLSLLASSEDLEQFFGNLADAMSPGGGLVVQILNYALPAMQEPRERVEHAVVDGANVQAVKTFTPQGNQTVLHLEFTVDGEMGSVTTGETVILRHWDVDTLRAAAVRAGWRETGCYGAYDKRAYDPAFSSDLILAWERPAYKREQQQS